MSTAEHQKKPVRRLAGQLAGEIVAQPSKSAAHRAVICAALAKGESILHNLALSEDVRATLGCVRALGLAQAELCGRALHISGGGTAREAMLNCNESGSTLRFLLPVAAALGVPITYTGAGRLLERPQEPLRAALAQHGVQWQGTALHGQLRPGEYALAGDVSSQFVSGLLFALPLLESESAIRLTTRAESTGYIHMTLQMLARFGVHAEWKEDVFTVSAPQKYMPRTLAIEGDYSHAAFFAVAGALGGGVRIGGLDAQSLQGDRAIFDLLAAMGAHVEREEDAICVHPAAMHGIEIDAADIPDLVPVLAVAACGAHGVTRIYNAGRLRLKESDRLAATASQLTRLGGDVAQTEDGLLVRGTGGLVGGEADACADHRIAMALAVAAGICAQEVLLTGGDCVAKSAPQFWEEFTMLGGSVQ